jgi:hypothetical protein
MIGSYLDYDSRVNFNAAVTVHDAAVKKINCRSHNLSVVINRFKTLFDNLRELLDVHCRLCHIRKLFQYLSTTQDLTIFSYSGQLLRTGIRDCAAKFSQLTTYSAIELGLTREDYVDILDMALDVVKRIDDIPLKREVELICFQAS